MSSDKDTNQRERIDVNDKAACESWAHRLNVTREKLREAVGAVGDDPRNVEDHLRRTGEKQQVPKGSM